MQHPVLKKLKKLGIFDITSLPIITLEESKSIEEIYTKEQKDGFTKNSRQAWEEYDFNLQRLIKYLDSNSTNNYYLNKLNTTCCNYFETRGNTLFHLGKMDKYFEFYIIAIGFLLISFFSEKNDTFKKKKYNKLIILLKKTRASIYQLNGPSDDQEFIRSYLQKIGLSKLDLIDVFFEYREIKSVFTVTSQMSKVDRNQFFEEQRNYYTNKYSNNYNNLRDMCIEDIQRSVLNIANYLILEKTLSFEDLENKINHDLGIFDLEFLSFSTKFRLEKTIELYTFLYKKTSQPGTLEYINKIGKLVNILTNLLEKFKNEEIDTSKIIRKIHYFSMIYDYSYFRYYGEIGDIDLIFQRGYTLQMLKYIKGDKGLKVFGESYWLNNDIFLNEDPYARVNKYFVEFIFLYFCWRDNTVKRSGKVWMDYINEALSYLSLNGFKKINNLFHLLRAKTDLKHLGFGTNHGDGDIFSLLDKKLEQLLHGEDYKWMDDKIHETDEIEDEKKKKEEKEKEVYNEINKGEGMHTEFKASFCIKPDLLINGVSTNNGSYIKKGGEYGWLEAIVQFLNTEGGTLYVGIWEIGAATDKGITQETLINAKDKGIIHVNKIMIPEYIIVGIDHDMTFENSNQDLFTRKITDVMKDYIVENPYDLGDTILIEYLNIEGKIISKIQVPKGKKYYFLKDIDKKEEKFLIRVNNKKETLSGSKMGKYIVNNPR